MEIIGRLMDQEYPYGGTEDRQLVKQATGISNALSTQLNESGQKLLDELQDIATQRIVLVQEEAFEVGVCIGVKLMCEVLSHE